MNICLNQIHYQQKWIWYEAFSKSALKTNKMADLFVKHIDYGHFYPYRHMLVMIDNIIPNSFYGGL